MKIEIRKTTGIWLLSVKLPLLLSTISVVDAKNGRWNKAGPANILCAKLKKWNTNGNQQDHQSTKEDEQIDSFV